MREYQSPIIKTEHDNQQMKEWLADSHYWVYEHQIYHCKWCGRLTTTVLEGDANLCIKNPMVSDLLVRKEKK